MFLISKKSLLIVLLILISGCTKKMEAVVSGGAATGKVSGTITLKSELAPSLKSTDVLYIIARREQVGPPSAVLRITKPAFPLKYIIGPENAMIPGIGGFEMNSNLTLAARISHSGDARPSSGDLEGAYLKNPAHPGDSGIDIAITQMRQ